MEKKIHASDCAIYNEPAYPSGLCDCGAAPEERDALAMIYGPNARKHYFDLIVKKRARQAAAKAKENGG